MRILYNIGIQLYGFSILVAGIFNTKATKWRTGRKDIFIRLKQTLGNSTQPLVWFHCASLGEFEQGRPVIEGFGKKFPNYKILLTFFSPSGYEVRKDYKGADYIFYLPLDTTFNAKKFIDIVKPSLAIFVKYEFWFNYLNELHTGKIPAFLVSAKFREDQYFFKNIGVRFRKSLHFYNTLFVQDEGSASLLKKFEINNVIVCGDTRFDRVIDILQQPFSDSIVQGFKNQQLLWICGSTWEEDERLIFPVFEKLIQQGQNLKLIIAPHDVSEARIKNIQSNYPSSIRYSQATESNTESATMLVVDKIGLLSYLYRFADMAYLGGGFGKGIHNLTEAAVYGIPVLFGPNYKKFNEAEELVKKGGGFSISKEEELNSLLTKLVNDSAFRANCGKSGAYYIQSGKGATEKIISEIGKVVTL